MRLNQVTLAARDLNESKAFYQRLGLRLIVDSPPEYARLELPDGEATVSLELAPGAVAGASVLYFECDDVDGTVARLMEEGVDIEQMPIDQPWLWREARLSDPSGNRLCLYHAGVNRRFPPWRVDGRRG